MFELPPPDDDGLYTPEVKSHSVDKHHYLRRYTHAFIEAMKNKPWKGLHYVDLFAGAGIERIKDDGLDWGSPLIAAQMPNKFSRLHLCEKNLRKFNALEMRISRFAQPSLAQLIRGDANQATSKTNWAQILTDIYISQIRTLGYTYIDIERIRSSAGQPLYKLIFCSKAKVAADIWRKISLKKPDGQWTFDFNSD